MREYEYRISQRDEPRCVCDRKYAHVAQCTPPLAGRQRANYKTICVSAREKGQRIVRSISRTQVEWRETLNALTPPMLVAFGRGRTRKMCAGDIPMRRLLQPLIRVSCLQRNAGCSESNARCVNLYISAARDRALLFSTHVRLCVCVCVFCSGSTLRNADVEESPRDALAIQRLRRCSFRSLTESSLLVALASLSHHFTRAPLMAQPLKNKRPAKGNAERNERKAKRSDALDRVTERFFLFRPGGRDAVPPPVCRAMRCVAL